MVYDPLFAQLATVMLFVLPVAAVITILWLQWKYRGRTIINRRDTEK